MHTTPYCGRPKIEEATTAAQDKAGLFGENDSSVVVNADVPASYDIDRRRSLSSIHHARVTDELISCDHNSRQLLWPQRVDSPEERDPHSSSETIEHRGLRSRLRKQELIRR